MSALRILLVLAFAAILAALVTEVVRRRNPRRSLVGQQQIKLRVLIAVLFLMLIGMILAGTYFIADMDPLVQILYWSLCLFLAFLIMIVAILDVRGVLINYVVERRNNLLGPHNHSGSGQRDD
ncbi:MAG: hypothetical protein IT209_04625 [Armatimonadetes bacterium]|nr:hypothetical protein [Armatimonadota bacterium]